jgi:hypothetical protein
MTNTAPVTEMRFVLDRVLGADRLAAITMFAEAGQETVEAILTDWLAESVPTSRAYALVPGEQYLIRAKQGGPANAARAGLAAFPLRLMLREVEALCVQSHQRAAGLYALEFAS